MEAVPVSDVAGVELKDIDLTAPLSETDQQRVRDLFAEHHLLLVRDQELTPEQHDRFVRYLGPLKLMPNGTYEEFVSNVRDANVAGTGRLLFHSDGEFRSDPAAGTSLHAMQVSASSPPTLFASGVRVYESLSPERQASLQQLTARHVLYFHPEQRYARVIECEIPPDAAAEMYPRSTHPLIKTLLNSGRGAIYLSEQQGSHIIELSAEDGEALIGELFGLLYSDDNVYAHHWRDGDLVVRDNIALQHGRPEEVDSSPRHLRRLVLETLAV
jgi:taurine dioxygenase